jgi:heme A synthase
MDVPTSARAFCIASPVPLAAIVLGELTGVSVLVWLAYLLSLALTLCGIGIVVRGIRRRAGARTIGLVTLATLIAFAPLGAVTVLLAVADPIKGLFP